MYLLTLKHPTLVNRSLSGSPRQTIPPIIKGSQIQANRRLTSKEIIRISKILQPGQPANTLRNTPTQIIMGNIQLLHTHQPRNSLRQRPHQLIKTDIKHRHITQQPNLIRDTRPQPVIHHNNLIQSIRHVPNTRRQTPVKLIIRQNNNRNRRITEVIR
ncbi:hypothetical protein HanPI659440_Chr00c27g0736621 [Helianthus annuus]|nr:hypothetical protein HanPI659440_Chr00c27g0736621 [Helianthus annuus]